MKNLIFSAIILCVIGAVDGQKIFNDSVLKTSKTITTATINAPATVIVAIK